MLKCWMSTCLRRLVGLSELPMATIAVLSSKIGVGSSNLYPRNFMIERTYLTSFAVSLAAYSSLSLLLSATQY